jgi:RNA polymerase sigma-70 factor, ECF subfamily
MVAISYPTHLIGNYESQNASILPTLHTRPNDLDSFNELVLAHQDAVYRQAYWIMGEEEAAEDATQEAFMRAFQHMHTYNGGPFLPWILRITTNYCLDQLRRQKIRRTTPLEECNEFDEEIEDSPWLIDTNASIEDIVERSEIMTRIMHCIKRLPAEYRVAVILVDLQNLDYQAAASSVGIPLGTFKSRLSRARAQLQKWLAHEHKTFLN